MEKEEIRKEIINWLLNAKLHIYTHDRAKLLYKIGALQAAEYYVSGNDLGLLIVSGLTRDQFEKCIVEMAGTPIEDWHLWNKIGE